MDDKSLELLTEDGRRLYEEFRLCQNEQELEALIERENKLNESQGVVEIPHFDMTADEFCKKYNLVSLEEIMERNGNAMIKNEFPEIATSQIESNE